MANKPKLTPEQIDSIPRRHANGQTDQQIADEFGVSAMTIFRHRNKDYYEKHKQAAKEYQRSHADDLRSKRKADREVFTLTYHKENDQLIIEKLRSVENIQNYVRQLIIADCRADRAQQAYPQG